MGGGPHGAGAGNSLLRVLLNAACVQNAVCCALLEKLTEYSAAEAAGDSSIPALIMGQLRWCVLCVCVCVGGGGSARAGF